MTIPVYQCYMYDVTRRSHRQSNSVEAIPDKPIADSSISGLGYGHELVERRQDNRKISREDVAVLADACVR